MRLDHTFPPSDPLSRFIFNYLKLNGIPAVNFLAALGYSNLGKASNKLLRAYETRYFDNDFISRMKTYFSHLGIDLTLEIEKKQTFDRKQYFEQIQRLQAEYEKHFIPFVFIETDVRRPTCSLAIYAITGGDQRWRTIPLKDSHVVRLDPFKRLRAVQRMVMKHYKNTQGKTLFFGNITGYRFQHAPYAYTQIGPDGSVVDDGKGKAPLFNVDVVVGGRLVPGHFWAHLWKPQKGGS